MGQVHISPGSAHKPHKPTSIDSEMALFLDKLTSRPENPAFDILSRQRNVVVRMIGLNAESSVQEVDLGSQIWKVLVYDDLGQNILSTLLNVRDMRKLGVTLFMNIKQLRQRVPEAPAIYFVQASKENIELIGQDCAKFTYDHVYLNFVDSLPRSILERLAEITVDSESATKIEQVYDQYTNFVSLEPQLFQLGMKDSYLRLNGLKDDIIMNAIDSIVEGLFSVCATMETIPVIRARPGEAAEMVATKLDSRIRAHLKQQNNLFSHTSGTLSFQRPLLIILDRSMDLTVMLHHPWTYQALVNDLLGMQANRVTILNSEDSSVASRSKTYDLDILGDEFWQANVGQPFPEVTERIDQELQAYKSAVEKIKGTQLRSSDEDLSNLTSGLASAIDSLPELQRKKAMVDTHTSLASALMKVLTDRSLDLYFSLEERMIVAGTNPDKGTLVELLDTQAKGSAEDKLRLFIIYYLTRSRKMSDAEFNDFQELLKSSGCDLSALVFLRRLHVMSSMNSASTVSDPKIASSLFGNFADKAIGKGIDWLAGNVKNLLPVKSDLLTTSVVKELMANTASQGPSGSNSMVSSENVGRYLYLDPKVGEEKAKNPPRNRTPFKEAIVFVVGGGNYVEHQNLQDFANRSKAPSSRSIIYGSTEIVSPNQFLEQLSGLGYSQDNPEINLT